MHFKKSSFSVRTALLVLACACCLSSASCSGGKENGEGDDVIVNFNINGSQPGNYPVNSDSPLSASFAYANGIANAVQGFYTDGTRSYYALKNINTSLVHRISGYGGFNVTEIANADGTPYANNSLDVYVKMKDGAVNYAGNSSTSGRVNGTRLGYYYYETHIRDLMFAYATKEGDYIEETTVDTTKEWHVHDMTGPVYKDGVMTVSSSFSEDPYVYTNFVNVPGDRYNAIEIEMSIEGTANSGQLFFCSSESGGFSGNRFGSFPMNPDGKMHKYLIDLTTCGYDGYDLTGVRLDLGDSGENTFHIKSVKAVKIKTSSVGYKLDKTFHMYSDKLHQEYRLVKMENLPEGSYEYSEFGVELKVPKDNVLQYKTEYEDDGKTVKYAAVDVKDAGIIGFIAPYDRENNISVSEEGGYIVLRQSTGQDTFGSRLYNDKTHDYAGIDKAAFEERNPITDISVEKTVRSGGKYVEYDSMRGAYEFTMNGTNFSQAFYNEPNGYFYSDISMKNDSGGDRNVYIWMNGKAGCLECAAVKDGNGKIVPIPTQVCKNFQGEIEEPFYDPEDKEYGDTFIPLSIHNGEKLDFTIYNLYQNWGVFPLKQLSSIQFHISYYHLSTGVTESNCIAPYFVYGKDLWTLPDFRGCSGIMWSGQPQFNSVGRLRFVSYIKDGTQHMPEYTGSDIRSSGTSYADLDYSYISDCGSYKYTLRHLEFPQNDENRTYYSLRLDFLKDLTVADVKNNLTLFSFDGRSEVFGKMSYSDENGKHVEKNVIKFPGMKEIIDIGGENAYFSYYGLNNEQTNITNFAYIIRNSDITVNSNRWNGHFALRNSYTAGLNLAELSLMEDEMQFKAGDHIYIDFILLPWGTGTSDTDENVQYVIQDSVINPVRIEAVKGSVTEDTYLPVIKAEGNEAEFTLSGGRNKIAVRIDGMTSISGITVRDTTGGGDKEYVISTTDYDGYQIIYNEDGTYSYVFIADMGNGDPAANTRTFFVKAA